MRGSGCIVLFFLVWSGIVALFDAWIGHTVWKQYQATGWTQVQGTVHSASVVVHHDAEDGDSYEPKLDYSYPVGSQRLHAWRVSFGNRASSREWADKVVAQYSPGSRPTVYVNPEEPTETVLEPGVKPGDLMFALFVLPFNFIALGVPLLLLLHVHLKFGPLDCPEWRRGARHGLHLDYKNPIAAGWLAGLAASFGLIVVNILLQMLFKANFWQVGLELVALVAVSLGAGLFTARRNADLARHCWVDPTSQKIYLPDLGELNWSELRPFTVEHEVTRDSDGDKVDRYYVQVTRAGQPPERWRKTSGEEQARAVAEWLNRHTDQATPA